MIHNIEIINITLYINLRVANEILKILKTASKPVSIDYKMEITKGKGFRFKKNAKGDEGVK